MVKVMVGVQVRIMRVIRVAFTVAASLASVNYISVIFLLSHLSPFTRHVASSSVHIFMFVLIVLRTSNNKGQDDSARLIFMSSKTRVLFFSFSHV